MGRSPESTGEGSRSAFHAAITGHARDWPLVSIEQAQRQPGAVLRSGSQLVGGSPRSSRSEAVGREGSELGPDPNFQRAKNRISIGLPTNRQLHRLTQGFGGALDEASSGFATFSATS